MKNSNVLELDKYETRCKTIRNLRKGDSLFSSNPLANILVIAFIIMDLAAMYSVVNILLGDNIIMKWIIALGFAAILDVPMSIAGNVLRQYTAKLRSKGSMVTVIAACLAAFLLVFSFTLALRITTADAMFGDVGTDGSSLVDYTIDENEAEDAVNHTAPMIAALNFGLLPAATSLAAFGITYAVSDPVNDKLRLLETERARVQAHIADLLCAIEEVEDVNTHMLDLIRREEALYKSFVSVIHAQAGECKQLAVRLIMEKLGGPADSISTLTEQAEEIHKTVAKDVSVPEFISGIIDIPSDPPEIVPFKNAV